MPVVVIRQLTNIPVLHAIVQDVEDCDGDCVENETKARAMELVNIFIKRFKEFDQSHFTYQYVQTVPDGL